MRIPGLVGAAGGETMASDAAFSCKPSFRSLDRGSIPMPLLLLLFMFALFILTFSSIGCGSSALIVDVEVERPRGFFNGPRWVSLNST